MLLPEMKSRMTKAPESAETGTCNQGGHSRITDSEASKAPEPPSRH